MAIKITLNCHYVKFFLLKNQAGTDVFCLFIYPDSLHFLDANLGVVLDN